MEERIRLGPVEILFVLFALLLILSSSTLFVSDISLRRYLLGWEEELLLEPVGVLEESNGETKRKTSQSPEFKGLKIKSKLYNFDTVLTDGSGKAQLALDDGSKIELGPNTMVKLSFAKRLSLTGIERSTVVNVVSGRVTGMTQKNQLILKSNDKTIAISEPEKTEHLETKAPPPAVAFDATAETKPESTVPTIKTEILSPRNGARFRVSDFSPIARVPISALWRTFPDDLPTDLILYRISGGKKEIVVEKKAQEKAAEKKLSVTLNRPGNYVLEVNKERVSFQIEKEFWGIKTFDPLVAGDRLKSNAYTGTRKNEFDITLAWEPYSNVEEYQIDLYTSLQTRKVALSKKVKDTKFTLIKNKILSKAIYFEVRSELENGFIALSKRNGYQFDFLPPTLVNPPHKTVITQKTLKDQKGVVIFSWETTHFTDLYELQLSTTPDFSKGVITKRSKDNFTVIRTPGFGTYWWRVKSFGKGVVSAPSSAFQVQFDSN